VLSTTRIKLWTFAEKIGFKRNIYNTYQVLAYAYAAKKNYLKAYEAQKLFIAYKDSLVGEDKQNVVAGLKFQYDLDKKQSEIAILTRDKALQAETANHQRLKIYALLIGFYLRDYWPRIGREQQAKTKSKQPTPATT